MALIMRATSGIILFSHNCFSKLTSNGAKLKLCRRYPAKVSSYGDHFYNVRFSHNDQSKTERHKAFVTYDDLIKKRRLQASKSMIVQVQSDKSCSELYAYCLKYGNINAISHYTTQGLTNHFVLIEFEDAKNLDAVLSDATHINFNQIIPVRSTMLWFRMSKNRGKLIKHDVTIPKYTQKITGHKEITDLLMSAHSITDQMMLLYENTKLNDVGTRLRFHTAHQMERGAFYGLFPNMSILPFGSSVNGFGKQGCDLDLVLSLDNEKTEKIESRLAFLTRNVSNNDKQHVKIYLDTIAHMMDHFVPGICDIKRILNARVPIIKYFHQYSGLDCDLSMANMTGVYMSELLYIYGELDCRVRPLVFTLRHWAKNMKLTNNQAPGRWITNFSLTLLSIFYLQQKKIIPTLNQLKQHATKEDIRIADQCIDCTFLRDINKLPRKDENVSSLQQLLIDFFNYYSSFDFNTQAISIREGTSIPKPDYSPLYICNPLETSLNVSKNVSIEETEKIRMAVRNSAWILETSENKGNRTSPWGLLSLIDGKNVSLPRSNSIINVANLFDGSEIESTEALEGREKKTANHR